MPGNRSGRFRSLLQTALPLVLASQAIAGAPSLPELRRMTLEELLNQEVVLTSRRPESLGATASAIQVITGEAIRQSGATRLPEALRLASNLQVAQIDSSRWAISARGFNSVLANKLLVQVDGRAIYSPLFAGVFWGSQDVFLEDVERIEVVSGPGGALWGANAVNGVIQVRSKPARDTQGLLVKAGGGEGLRALGSIRYGAVISPSAHFRVYGKFSERDDSQRPSRAAARTWDSVLGGFRFDAGASRRDRVTVQGDLYENDSWEVPAGSILRGGNLLARWTREIHPDAGLQLQIYFDREQRQLPGSYADRMDTWDFDFQHHFAAGARHRVVWGAGYRHAEDTFDSERIVLLPRRQDLANYNLFLQDEVKVTNQLRVTGGVKVEKTHFTGVELQPSVRAAWEINERAMTWAAVSRAIRTPSRLDRHRHIQPVLAGSPEFESESLLAWETGTRLQPGGGLSVSLATFFHDYDDLRSIENSPPGWVAPRVVGNGQEGRSYGLEATVDWRVSARWRLHAGWTELRVKIQPKPGSTDQSYGSLESVDSDRHLSLRSTWNLTLNLEASAALRHVGRIEHVSGNTPAYTELDLRVAWSPSPRWELALSGRNLLDDQHLEYRDSSNRFEVERQAYATVQWTY